MNMIELIAECKKHKRLLKIMTFIDLVCIVASYFAIFFELLYFPLSFFGCTVFTPLIVLIPEFMILFLLISIQVIAKYETIKLKETD